MRLINIKNKYIFHSDKPEQSHRYLLYYDRKYKETRLVKTTHLYEIPEKKKYKLKKGYIKEFKFKGEYLPTGVKNEYITKDINGNKLKYKSLNYKNKRAIPENQAKKIKAFAKYTDK